METSERDTKLGASIAGRYRVEQRLARGGMGEVFAVVDESTGRRVALKRMLDAGDGRMVGMFEREYHALVGLRHPRIIEVYDYGVDQGLPYYTMELLDGQDLRQLAPLPYRRACRYVRDVASSLALLHARKLLHRDVSPRNVRVTSDDRVKLIDFGAMASFGMVDVVVGTPPYVAPEAAQRAPLDQRADLFALGALAYWLLTGRHAFPARTMQELPDMWRAHPPRPSQVIASDEVASQWIESIPEEVDDLVMSLLTPNPLGRPATAIEVIERLSPICGTPDEQEELSARAYLSGAEVVGRERERMRLRKRLDSTLRGSGASVLIEAVSGMGSSRLLAELAVEAQLSGAGAVVVDAKIQRGVYGVAHSLVEKLLQAVPELGESMALPHADILARFSVAFGFSEPKAPTGEGLPPGELRRRTQNALAEWILAISQHKPLVIAIDNAQRVDEASAALLATVARATRRNAVMLVVARKPGEVSSSPSAMRAIEESGATITLRGLSREHVHALVRNSFGDVPNTGRLSEWLCSLSGGNPQACMELVHHLIERRVIRYAQGAWTLPQELLPHELPESLDQAFDARIERLSEEERRLSEALCVHRGPLPIERCLAVAVAERVREPLAVLGALACEDVLVQSGPTYHFAHDSLRERIYERLAPMRRQELHRQMGRSLSNAVRDLNNQLDAGFHLLHGGAESEGADLLAEAGKALAYDGDELAAAVPALEAALVVFRKEGRPRYETVKLLAPLAIGGYRVDRRLGTDYGDEATALLGELVGLSVTRKLRPWLGRHLSLYVGLGFGFARSLLPGRGGPREIVRHIRSFFTCCVSLAGAATLCLDGERARRFADMLEPLVALGKNHIAYLAHQFALVLARLPEDRLAEVADRSSALLARFEEPRPIRGLTPDTRALIVGGMYYALGAMSCFRDGPLSLHCAEKLDALGLKLYSMAADQLRAMHHALRGEVALATAYRERVELQAIQASTGWQVEIWQPSGLNLVCLLSGDVIGQKSVAEQLDRLALEIPSLERSAKIARASYLLLKGDAQAAFALRTSVLESTVPRGYIGWPASIGAQVDTLLALGRPEEARQLALMLIEGMSEEDSRYISMYQQALIGLSMAEIELGMVEQGVGRLERLIAQHAKGEGPLTLGNLHAARARAAIRARDSATARVHLKEMDRWFRPTKNPALVAQCERMRRDVIRLLEELGEAPRTETAARPSLADELQTIRSVLSQCAGSNDRAHRALELLVHHVQGARGFLFAYQPSEQRLRLLAPSHGDEAPLSLQHEILDSIARAGQWGQGDDDATSLVSSSALSESVIRTRAEGESAAYRSFLLSTEHDGRVQVIGAVAVLEGATPIGTPRAQLLEAVARALFEAGDPEREDPRDSIPVTTAKLSGSRK